MRSPTPSRTLAAVLPTVADGSTVTLCGHVHRRRELASVGFLVLRDRSGLAQVVAVPGTPLPPEETVVSVTGIAVTSAKAPGGVEVAEPKITILSEPAHTAPFDLWRPSLTAGLPVLLDNAALAWRHPAQRARWEIAAASLAGFRRSLDAQGFTEIQTPKLVSTATESGANVFSVDYFGRTAYLAQSPQLYKQQLVGVVERVYEVGPVFRAEPHDTVRHLAEYVSLDAELGFIADHRDVLAVLRSVLAGMIEAIEARATQACERLNVVLPVIDAEIPVIHFAEALRLVGAPDDEPDLAPDHERQLGEWARRTHGSDLLAVEGYPAVKRPFYTHPWTGAEIPGGPWTNSFDLLFRGVELVTGGQRLHRHSDYLAALGARGESLELYESYLQAFASGMPPHGGFAIGLERWVARLVEATNVREVTLFPRDRQRLTP
jgi:nondiscriminating aspartyl-tRNA synthetase